MNDWTRNGDGRGWRYDGDLVIAELPPQDDANLAYESHPGGGYIYRTHGVPSSMENLFQDFGKSLEEAAEFFELPLGDIMALIGIEADRLPNNRFNMTASREEQGFESDSGTPHRVSSGLTQCLLSTFNSVQGDFAELMDPIENLTRYELWVPRRSILGGAAYMARQFKKHPDRVMAFVAAYNAGGVYSDDNVWNMRTYSDTRIDRWMAFVNDWTAALK